MATGRQEFVARVMVEKNGVSRKQARRLATEHANYILINYQEWGAGRLAEELAAVKAGGVPAELSTYAGQRKF